MHAKNPFLLFMATIMLLFMSIAVSGAQVLTKKDLVRQAKESVEQVAVEDAKVMLEKGWTYFIDCREEKEFKRGHIPGALHIPRGWLEFRIEELVPDRSAAIVLYCRSGDRSCLGVQSLNAMGYVNARKPERRMAGLGSGALSSGVALQATARRP